MKKGISKLLSALLIATLVFTSAGVAFAGTEGEAGSDQMKVTGEKAALGPEVSKIADKLKKKITAQSTTKHVGKKQSSGSFALKTLVTGNESVTATQIYYGAGDTLTGNQKGYSQQVKLPAKGTITMALSGLSIEEYGAITFGLYKDKALTQKVDTTGYASTNNEKIYVQAIQVPAAGTYYLGVQSYISPYSANQNYCAVTAVAYVNGADRTLPNKAWRAIGVKKPQTNYLKFKASNSGYVKVYTAGFSGKVTLMNSKKKSLSNAVYRSKSEPNVTFGVKKGATYYLRMASSYTNYEGGYQVKYSNGKITDKSGSKKSKARTMKRKSTYKGSIIAGSGTVDWYKFKVTSKKKVTITMKGATNNKLKAVVYTKKGKNIGSTTFYDYNAKRVLQSVGKLSKGTYYVKVYRGTKTSSGWYSLSWK